MSQVVMTEWFTTGQTELNRIVWSARPFSNAGSESFTGIEKYQKQ